MARLDLMSHSNPPYKMENDPQGWYNEMDESIDLPPDTEDHISHIIDLVGKWSRFHNFPLGVDKEVEFLPKSCIDKLSERHIISQVIPDQALANEIFEKGRVLFVIVIYCLPAKAEGFLRQAIEGGINDETLPVEDDMYSGAFQDADYFGDALEIFHPNQARFCLPVMKASRDQQYTNGSRLPIYIHQQVEQGGFGEVYQVEIHPDYNEISEVRFTIITAPYVSRMDTCN